MKKTTLTRKLPALVLALTAGQALLTSSAGAQTLGDFVTRTGAPAPAPVAAAAPAAAPAPAQASGMVDVEGKLAALKYDVGPVDGTVDGQTHSAIMAFQKVYGFERTGGLTDPVTTKIMATQTDPPPLVANGEPHRVEVDLARQVLFLYEGGTLAKIVPVSTGTSETPTPTGTFRIYRQEAGWHTSSLGRLHNAQYFTGGYAIHGSGSVPPEPASHGCIRIPMTASEWFPSHVAMGMQVIIV